MLIAPLVPHLNKSAGPTVFGVSGYSGAGTTTGTNPKVPPESLNGAIRAYSLTDHIHEREAGHHLSRLADSPISVSFTPAVAPWFSAILSVASIPLDETMRASDVRKLYEDFYADAPLVSVQSAVPEISSIAGQQGVRLGGFQVHSSGKRVVIVGVLDNLLKGAATQCLQVRLPYRAAADAAEPQSVPWLRRARRHSRVQVIAPY